MFSQTFQKYQETLLRRLFITVYRGAFVHFLEKSLHSYCFHEKRIFAPREISKNRQKAVNLGFLSLDKSIMEEEKQ